MNNLMNEFDRSETTVDTRRSTDVCDHVACFGLNEWLCRQSNYGEGLQHKIAECDAEIVL